MIPSSRVEKDKGRISIPDTQHATIIGKLNKKKK
jgi:hypothetical protein